MKKNKSLFGRFYSPYSNNREETMNDWYAAYQNDPAKLLHQNGTVYSKIIHRCEFYSGDGHVLLVALEPQCCLRIGDSLMDEDGREFIITAFEMIHFSTGVPDWYHNVRTIAIRGKDYSIGQYLAKQE